MNQPDWERAKRYILGRLAEGLPDDLTYHSIHHTRDDVLPAAERLAAMAGVSGEELLLLRAAALYHDVGYLERYFCNETIAVRIAAETLPDFGFSSSQIQVMAGMIMATQLPQSPRNFLEELMCDADLDSLGREDYLATSHNLRLELLAYGVPTTFREWYERQLGFLMEHSYFTAVAQSLRGAGKLRNMAELEKRLENPEIVTDG